VRNFIPRVGNNILSQHTSADLVYYWPGQHQESKHSD